MSAKGSLVELKDVRKTYRARPESPPVDVLCGVDLEVQRGESIAVVGPSGSGKSTLLHLIGGLLPPSSGQVLFDGQDLAHLSLAELARLRNLRIGYVFQLHHLLPQCSVLENVLVPTLVRPDADAGALEQRAGDLLASVGLADRLGHRPGQLSGGECQRVALVRALVNSPEILLADEPTGSLDADSAAHLADLLCRLNEQEAVALLVVTHSPALAQRMRRAVTLRKGRLS
jgi:ABC-type lipoprotein export system ATPase subunit